jgi:hypothetical protein
MAARLVIAASNRAPTGALLFSPGAAIMNLSEREAITDVRLLVKSLVVLGAVTIAFVLHTVLHLEPAVVALLGAGVLVAVAKLPVPDTLREVEWPTLAFFIGLFVMVGGLINTGVIETVSQAAAEATGGRLLLTSMVLLSAGTVPVERTHAVGGQPARPEEAVTVAAIQQRSFVVTLAEGVEQPDAEAIAAAIRLLNNVVSVEPFRDDAGEHDARERADAEWRGRIVGLLDDEGV